MIIETNSVKVLDKRETTVSALVRGKPTVVRGRVDELELAQAEPVPWFVHLCLEHFGEYEEPPRKKECGKVLGGDSV